MSSNNLFDNITEEQINQWNYLYENSIKHFNYPVILQAEVVHGFKRGSRELGIPTANMSMVQLGSTGESLDTGIYYGWTKLKGQIYPAVCSIGWNPYYKNEKKTIEVHLLTSLEDFYGENITTLLCGYLRQEANFKSLDELISCIHSDILHTKKFLNELPASHYSVSDNWKQIERSN